MALWHRESKMGKTISGTRVLLMPDTTLVDDNGSFPYCFNYGTMEDQVLTEATWPQEAEAAINDIRKHVKSANISTQLKNDNQRIYINLTTLENSDYCVEMSAAGFRVVGRTYDDTSLAIIENMNYETPYALLNNISQKYRESFGGELMNKLLDLAKKET